MADDERLERTITISDDEDVHLIEPVVNLEPIVIDLCDETIRHDEHSGDTFRSSQLSPVSYISSSPEAYEAPQSRGVPLTKAELKKLERQKREKAKTVRKKEKELEKLLKETNRQNAANKALENCTANVSTNILKIINDNEEITLKTLFDESMIKYRLSENMKIENSITWTYKRAELIDGEQQYTFKESEWLMVIMEGSEYLERMLAYKQSSCNYKSMKVFLSDIKRRSKLNVILLVFNLANHLKSERAKEAKNYRKAFKDRFESTSGSVSSNSVSDPSSSSTVINIGESELLDLRLELEMDMKSHNLDWKLHMEFYEKTADLVQTLVRYTLSIAKYEVKQKVRSSTGLDWAINMDKGRAVDPTKSSEDLKNLWIAQLQQFSLITLPMAKAIANEYPSPYALLDQYENLTIPEAENLLAELYVQRNLKRQLGSNISKRIHRFMTCNDPDVHIGYS